MDSFVILIKFMINMRKLFLLCVLCLLTIGAYLHAQEKQDRKLGYLNSFAIGVNIGTTGWGVDIATPIGQYLALRAGVTIMPNISYSDDVDVSIDYNSSYYPDASIPTSIEVEGGMGRTAGEILLNLYPFKRSSFFLTGGAVFGGDKLIKVKGHSDELANYMQDFTNSVNGVSLPGIEIGDYTIPVDKNGNVSGGIKVSSFRPYLGLGFGRIVPKNKRIGFLFELGVQIHGTPEVYTDYGSLGTLLEEADNDFSEILDKVTVYPVMRFRLCGKFF